MANTKEPTREPPSQDETLIMGGSARGIDDTIEKILIINGGGASGIDD